MVRHYCLDQTEKKDGLGREEKGENMENKFLTDFEIQRKENMKDGRRKEERKKEVPSCTRNQTQNLQVGSVPLLLAF